MKRYSHIHLYISIVIAIVAIHSCSNNTIAPTAPASVSLIFESGSLKKIGFAAASYNKRTNGTVDSVSINRIRILLRNVKLRSAKDSVTFVQQPKVIEFSTAQKPGTVDVQSVHIGNYLYLDVEVFKPPLNADSLPEYSSDSFKEFLESEHYSIIVDGVVFDQQSKSNFTFKVRAGIRSRIIFSPQLIVASGKEMTIAVAVNTSSWFNDQSTGYYLNPVDSGNELDIYNNIANSFSQK